MGTVTTAYPTSAKVENLLGAHCWSGNQTTTGSTTLNSTQLSSLASTANIFPGMSVSGTNIPANSYVGAVTSTSTVLITQQATSSGSGITFTFGGNDFKMALVKVSPTGTYDATTANYSNLTGNSDEVTGTGYVAGGYDITPASNTTPTSSGTTAYTTPNVNPVWTSASFSTIGCILYNASSTNRVVYVGSFGGTQQVTSGTFTVLMPTNNSSSALVRIQ